MYRNCRIVHGRGEREIAVPEATALGEQHRAPLEVEPLDADMLTLARTALTSTASPSRTVFS
jgi:hypothetical protein